MVRESFASAKGTGLKGDVGASPQKILKYAISTTLRPIAVSKMFRKLIVIFFLALKKRTLSSAVLLIFIINNYCHTPLMLTKRDTSFLPRTRTKTCTVHFYVLFTYAPRVYSLDTVISLGKRLVISGSQCQGVNGSLDPMYKWRQFE